MIKLHLSRPPECFEATTNNVIISFRNENLQRIRNCDIEKVRSNHTIIEQEKANKEQNETLLEKD